MDDYYYSTRETAQLLGISTGRVRQMLGAGELPATHDDQTGAWKIEAHAVNTLREKRRKNGLLRPSNPRPGNGTPDAPPEAGRSQKSAGEVRVADDILSNLIRDIRRLERERGELESEVKHQRQITARSESSMQEERERERTNLESELQVSRERVRQLERQIEGERSRTFWSRIFGR